MVCVTTLHLVNNPLQHDLIWCLSLGLQITLADGTITVPFPSGGWWMRNNRHCWGLGYKTDLQPLLISSVKAPSMAGFKLSTALQRWEEMHIIGSQKYKHAPTHPSRSNLFYLLWEASQHALINSTYAFLQKLARRCMRWLDRINDSTDMN